MLSHADRERFTELVKSIPREGANELLEFLNGSDFFEAPASLKLHHASEGGLCRYSLARYDFLTKLADIGGIACGLDSLLITGLLASINKTNYFEQTFINKKVYCADGDKHDERGKFRWESEAGYKVKDPEERFVFGTSGQNAERLITNYMPLRDAESAAIVNLGVTYENPTFNYAQIYKKYPLACLLAQADQLATYFDLEGEVPF